MYKQILIPLDGSPLAELAVEHAIGLASLCEGHVAFVRVAEPAEVHEAAEYLKRMTELYPQSFSGPEAMVKFGVPHEQIVAAAYEIEADLIVLSSHGRTGFSRQIFGSVAEGVVRAAPCPVLVVKASQSS